MHSNQLITVGGKYCFVKTTAKTLIVFALLLTIVATNAAAVVVAVADLDFDG